MTTQNTADDRGSTWPDALAFLAALAMAWWSEWTAADLVWSLWLSSLVVGYATIIWTIFQPGVAIAKGAWRDRALVAEALAQSKPLSGVAAGTMLLVGGLLLLAFFTVHFGMFHYFHSQFLVMFFPIDTGDLARSGVAGMSTYLEVARRYWWFLPAAFLAERAAFLRAASQPAQDTSVTAAAIAARKSANALKSGSNMMAPYRNVVRMHLLIFFFAFAHFARVDNFAVYAVVYAVYFFPWRLTRRPSAVTEPTPVSRN